MIRKLLIANRGEIAVRILRACREMGIETLAVYSQADRSSLHVQLADEAICIGPAAASESYLRLDRILSAAELANADAIHPGYGFLSENPNFAQLCEDCRIRFVGPSAETIRQMGDKARAKEVARRAGVPTVPGSEGVLADEGEALALAEKIGWPVLLKAVAGGGGRGMRLVSRPQDLSQDFLLACHEAERNFGRGELYLEKYIEAPRHIELQILADAQGHCVHLGERDCSVQRRYQKLMEEAPSPFLDEPLRRRMGEAAIRIAQNAHYEGVGTVEFLVDGRKNFYFMEMNTRLQVEHGVTEEATGIDLVQQQLRVAMGEPLSLRQEDIHFIGHALECRINAEDPERNFAPSPGRISLYHAPGGPGIRMDSSVYGGYEIPTHYDSLVGKLIATGATRPEAIQRLEGALAELRLEGIATTAPLVREILRDEDFREGRVTTHFLQNFLGRSRSA